LAEIFEWEKWLDFHPRIVEEIVMGTKITKNMTINRALGFNVTKNPKRHVYKISFSPMTMF
jgi:hypothetical protein